MFVILTNILRCFISNGFVKYLDKTECYVFTNYSHISCAGSRKVSLIIENTVYIWGGELTNSQLIERHIRDVRDTPLVCLSIG